MSVLDRIRSGEYFYSVLTLIGGKVAPIQDGGKAKKELLQLAEIGEIACKTVDSDKFCKGHYQPDCCHCNFNQICRKRAELKGAE